MLWRRAARKRGLRQPRLDMHIGLIGGIGVAATVVYYQRLTAVMAAADDSDIFIATAAVADYHVRAPASEKIKRRGDDLALQLAPNPDILAAVAALRQAPFTVGFAAETEALIKNAEAKLARKNIDMIAANLVGGTEIGFNSDDNELTVIWAGGSSHLTRGPKSRLAQQLIALIAERCASPRTGKV